MLLLLISSNRLSAQVTFRNPTFPSGFGAPSDFIVNDKYVDTPSDPIVIAASGTTTLKYSVQLYRPVGSSSSGYVDIFLGTSQTALVSIPLTSPSNRPTTSGRLWSPISGSSFELLYLSGICTVDATTAAGQTGLYAVYYEGTLSNATKGEISHPVSIKASPVTGGGTPPPPSGGSNPIVYFSCGNNNEICKDQCIASNSVPAIIMGRTLNSASPEEERVTWEYSTDKVNWYEAPTNVTYFLDLRDYQPQRLTTTTYFRRVSTHKEYRLPGLFGIAFGHREYWYTSNIVTITVPPKQPIPVNTTYTTCGGPLTIAVYPAMDAVSYQWYSADPTWDVNGTGRGTPWEGGSTSVQITPPAGVAPGTYQFYVSANSNCGWQYRSPDATIYVTVNPGNSPVSMPTGIARVRQGSGCNVYYQVTTAPLSNATSYLAQSVDGDYSATGYTNPKGLIQFDLGLPSSYQGTLAVTATGVCNSATASFELITPPSKCATLAAARVPAELKLYPNPATEQVSIGIVGQEAVATFYDAQGVVRKKVVLKSQSEQTSVSTQDLPAGFYHVRITANGKPLLEKQLVIQH